jgi:hypothetical protein
MSPLVAGFSKLLLSPLVTSADKGGMVTFSNAKQGKLPIKEACSNVIPFSASINSLDGWGIPPALRLLKR